MFRKLNETICDGVVVLRTSLWTLSRVSILIISINQSLKLKSFGFGIIVCKNCTNTYLPNEYEFTTGLIELTVLRLEVRILEVNNTTATRLYANRTYEPPRWKTNNVVSEKVGHKPGCTSRQEG